MLAPLVKALLLASCTSLAAACTTGPLKVRETHYFAVSNGENTNYYRLRVSADTHLGVASYREGWFPASAVDSLFGDVSDEGGAKETEAREALREDYRKSIVKATRNWLAKAVNANADEGDLKRLLEARRRVLAYPQEIGEPFPGSFEVDYNPERGIAMLHADEKMVFVLSADPDEVVGKIANFAESDKTVYSISQLAKVVAQRGREEVAADEARDQVRSEYDGVIAAQIADALDKLGTAPPGVATEADAQTVRNQLQREVGILLELLRTLEASR